MDEPIERRAAVQGVGAMATAAPVAASGGVTLLHAQWESRKRLQEQVHNAKADRKRKRLRDCIAKQSVSNKTTRRHTVNELVQGDRATLLKELVAARPALLTGIPVSVTGLTRTKPIFTETQREHVHLSLLPIWDHADQFTRGVYLHQALGDRDNMAFTLNVHPDVIPRWLEPGQRGGFPYQAYQALSRCLRQAARRIGMEMPRFWFAVDTNEEGRLHLHGGITVATPNRTAIEQALRKAVGYSQQLRGGSHLVLKPTTCAVGWVQYASRNWELVRLQIRQDRTQAGSRELVQAARRLYEADRLMLGRSKGNRVITPLAHVMPQTH